MYNIQQSFIICEGYCYLKAEILKFEVLLKTFRIEELSRKDKEKQALAKAKNDLETFIVDMQDKLWQDRWEKASTEGERSDIREKLSAASDWLYEQDDETQKSVSESETTDLIRPNYNNKVKVKPLTLLDLIIIK